MGFFHRLVKGKAPAKKASKQTQAKIKTAKPKLKTAKASIKRTIKKAKPVKTQSAVKKSVKKSISKAIKKASKPARHIPKAVKKTVKKPVKKPSKPIRKQAVPKPVKKVKVMEFKDPEKVRACPECGSRRVRYSEFNQALICKECGSMYPELAPELEDMYRSL